MPVGERIKRQLEEREIKEEQKRQERRQLLEAIDTASEELNKKMLKAAEPFLEVLEKAGLYEIFKEIRRTFNLEWKREPGHGGCLWVIKAILSPNKGDIITPAILNTYIVEKDEVCLVINERGKVSGGFGLPRKIFGQSEEQYEERLRKKPDYLASKTITIANCSLELSWGRDYEEIGLGWGDSESRPIWNTLTATVALDKKSRLPFITIKAKDSPVRLSPGKWQDKGKVEDAVAKVYLRAFPSSEVSA